MSDLELQPLKEPYPVETPVFPCCCGVPQEKYFNGFTIFNIVMLSLGTISDIFKCFDGKYEDSLFSLAFNIAFLIWTIVVFVHYKKTRDYGTKSAYFLAMFMIIAGFLFVILVIVFTVLVILGYKDKFFPDLKEAKESCIYIGVSLMLVFCAYMIYLNVLYFKVIKNRKEYGGHAPLDLSLIHI